MESISKKILFLGLGLAFAQPMATHAAEPLAQASAQAAKVILGATLRTKVIENFLVPFGRAAKDALLRTGAAVGTGLAIEDICLSDDPGPLGAGVKHFFADNLGIIIPSNKCEASTTALVGPRTVFTASTTDSAPSEPSPLPNTSHSTETSATVPGGENHSSSNPTISGILPATSTESSNSVPQGLSVESLENSASSLEEPSSPSVSIWDVLKISPKSGDQAFPLTDDEKKAFLQTVGNRVLENPVGGSTKTELHELVTKSLRTTELSGNFDDSLEPSSPGVSIWDVLKISPKSGDQAFPLTDDEKKAFLQTVGNRVLENPVGGSTGGRISITITPVPKQAVSGAVGHLGGSAEAPTTPPTQTSPTPPVPTSTIPTPPAPTPPPANLTPPPVTPPAPPAPPVTPPVPPAPPTPTPADTGWIASLKNAITANPLVTTISNNPKMSAAVYVVGGTLLIRLYKQLKLYGYRENFRRDLDDFTQHNNQASLEKCARLMHQADPLRYPNVGAVNRQMATDFIDRFTTKDIRLPWKHIWPLLVAPHALVFSACGKIASLGLA